MDLKLPPNYQALGTLALQGDLIEHAHSLRDAYDALPRWRWLRRYHLERQMLLITLAIDCYNAGWSHAPVKR